MKGFSKKFVDFIGWLYDIILEALKLLFKLLLIFLLFYYAFVFWDIEIVKQVIELIRVLIWPLIVLFFLTSYREETSTFLRRITGLKTPLGEINAEHSEKLQKAEVRDEDQKMKALLDKAVRNGLEDFLKYHFEKTYRLIFGSQLDILKLLRTSVDKKMSFEAAMDIYKTSEFAPGYTFTDYMNFLYNSSLISLNAVNKTVELKPVGDAFIQYLINERIPLIKKPY